MIDIVLVIALFLLGLSTAAGIYRVVAGPSTPDRVLALDTVGINMIAGVALLSLLLRSYAFMDVILLLGVLSFVGTIALSRFIERGYVIERKRND